MSSRKFNMIYQMPPISLLLPAADAAGRTSAFRNLRNSDKSYIVCQVNQGNDTPVTFTILQAQDVSGTGAKPVNAMPIYLNNDVGSSDGFLIQEPAASFTVDATLSGKIVVFEILADSVLDTTNAFTTIAVRTSASNAANITDGTLYLGTTYPGQNLESTYQN